MFASFDCSYSIFTRCSSLSASTVLTIFFNYKICLSLRSFSLWFFSFILSVYSFERSSLSVSCSIVKCSSSIFPCSRIGYSSFALACFYISISYFLRLLLFLIWLSSSFLIELTAVFNSSIFPLSFIHYSSMFLALNSAASSLSLSWEHS